MRQPTSMIRPKFYIARRDTRWDICPQREPVEIVAHDWHGFWSLTPAGEWFRTPTSYHLVREITESEANDPAFRAMTLD